MRQATVIILSLVVLFLLGAGCASKEPTEPTTGISQMSEYSENWTEFARVEGDLNNDNRQDIVLALKSKDENINLIKKATRKLVIELQQEDGTYLTALETDYALMCGGCGGVWGDPFDSITIEDNTLVISHYGGSSFRWANSYSFKLVDGVWMMVAESASSFYTNDPENQDEYDWDMDAQEPGETTLDEFDIMLGII